MKSHQHGSVSLCLLSIFFFIVLVGAQPNTPPPNSQYPYARFSPSMAIIIVVLIAALFFMGFFSIYIRHCSDSSAAAGTVRRAISMRARRAAAARGLDRALIDTFPTFSYSEVKDHQIGKGALECAVCLNEFEENETLRLIPKCDHVFHPECIDAWLVSHVTCPVCRANLSPQIADEQVQNQNPQSNPQNDVVQSNDNVEEIVIIQVDEENQNQNQNQVLQGGSSSSSDYPNRPPRSWSIRRPFGFGKFRSHSTGHSLVQPGENLDRFTLRLPEEVRKEVMNRATLNRTRSHAVTLPREGSSRRAYRRIERPEPEGKSDRWAFFTRGLSMRSPKVVAEGGEGSGSSRTPAKMPSFKCLEPKTADEAGLIPGDPDRRSG